MTAPYEFLIESMVVATAIDGQVDERELNRIHDALIEHEIFRSIEAEDLSASIGRAYMKLNDEGLDARILHLEASGCSYRERLLAFALATRISFADGELARSELSLLKRLQSSFGLDEGHVSQLFEAASAPGSLDDIVQELYEAKLQHHPHVEETYLEIMLMMALADGEIQPEEATELGLMVAQRVEFVELAAEDVSAALQRALSRILSTGVEERLEAASKVLLDETSRLRAVGFALRILAADGAEDMGETLFLDRMVEAFGLNPLEIKARLQALGLSKG